MRVVVPFAAESPKTRLSPVLAPPERETVARAMLADVLTAIAATEHEPTVTVLATAPLDFAAEDVAVADSVDADIETDLGLAADVASTVSVAVDQRPLTAAVNARLAADDGGFDGNRAGEGDDEPLAVVMADLALATPDALDRLFACEADVAVAPGRGSGTNALVVRHPDFRVDYHGTSYLDHREIAREIGATLEAVDSFRLATDIDEPADLVEVLVHGSTEARTPAVLRELGFVLDDQGGRVEAVRESTAARSGAEDAPTRE